MGLISTLQAIGDAIRSAESSTAKILLTDMPTRIKTLATNKYNSGYSAGNTDGYASGKTDGYASGKTDGYNSGYSTGKADGAAAVTLSSSVSGRTVTTKASNGKTSSGSVALGTNSGSLTFTLTTSGNGSATKSLSAGYYNAGTITAKGSNAISVSLVWSNTGIYQNTPNYTITGNGIYMLIFSAGFQGNNDIIHWTINVSGGSLLYERNEQRKENASYSVYTRIYQINGTATINAYAGGWYYTIQAYKLA